MNQGDALEVKPNAVVRILVPPSRPVHFLEVTSTTNGSKVRCALSANAGGARMDLIGAQDQATLTRGKDGYQFTWVEDDEDFVLGPAPVRSPRESLRDLAAARKPLVGVPAPSAVVPAAPRALRSPAPFPALRGQDSDTLRARARARRSGQWSPALETIAGPRVERDREETRPAAAPTTEQKKHNEGLMAVFMLQ
jgi:hypothetical protein